MTEQSWPSDASERVRGTPTSPTSPELSVATIERQGDDRVVTVRGEVDAYSAPQLHACLEEVTGSSQRRVVIDVRDVAFIDSSGVGVLVAAVKRLREDGRRLVVRGPTRQMTKLLEMTGLRELVTVD